MTPLISAVDLCEIDVTGSNESSDIVVSSNVPNSHCKHPSLTQSLLVPNSLTSFILMKDATTTSPPENNPFEQETLDAFDKLLSIASGDSRSHFDTNRIDILRRKQRDRRESPSEVAPSMSQNIDTRESDDISCLSQLLRTLTLPTIDLQAPSAYLPSKSEGIGCRCNDGNAKRSTSSKSALELANQLAFINFS